MTPKLPVVSGLECIKALEKIGYKTVRQKGSHIRLKNINGRLPSITIPDHKELRPGLLKRILKDANLTIEEFRELC
ncbi:type II toxin-antitoxin system HicA family toxin [Desulfitibacter alkalitolerans]|uniref:type II toxin-antitoxin system HicA family toxin n=1 Tax=Desulfitibacter alkalitolerans TaxID=264641 RepID=UPI000484AA3D|nr:type II toxin-antitoxin system HicA family toxin [Desulfitibacter alkalitolerans]